MPERCVAIEVGADEATVTTDRRTLRAERVVIAGGPWSGDLLRMVGIELPLAPAIAQVTFLEAPQLVDRPGFVDWLRDDRVGVYGHPVPGIGYKVAFDAASTEPWLPDVEAWPPDLAEQDRLIAWLDERMPAVEPRVAFTQRHPWTMTPDGDFAIDRRGPIVVAAGCSGHAFKFGPALGALVADVTKASAGTTSTCSRSTGRRCGRVTPRRRARSRASDQPSPSATSSAMRGATSC